ncbi:MAG: glutamate-5-semialdehyde dehydrogenase [Clostridiales Family XIII bacterium]|jgi:glutamate-5-semialdehyde dehydrogenase|nr:glutamate-5-semialdehyde dehydrogenase [Clostridiales Family XIII bacterium]
MDIRAAAAAAKESSYILAAQSGQIRDFALESIIDSLRANRGAIIAENEKDLEAAEHAGLPAPIVKRLRFDGGKIDEVIAGIGDLIKLPNPLGKTIAARELDEGLRLEQVTCPIGVIGVIFESRPDALVQIASLCIKSGNCAVLKGGSEAAHTNRILFENIQAAGLAAGLPVGFLTLAESREEISSLLHCDESIDLIIPRGSNEFVKYIMDNSNIPVMGHADGVCHVYVDECADIEKAVPIVRDSKVQYAAACNAAETVLVHRGIADRLLPPLGAELGSRGVTVRGTDDVRRLLPEAEAASDADWRTEYLDLVLSIRLVDSANEAIRHINAYGSHHTDCIVTESDETAELFMRLVDSAGVYRNCSTRFADGFRYGLGAEVGISTGKLHARGPVGLDGLTTYKYKLTGNGHIVDDYASGKKSFHFKELQPDIAYLTHGFIE